MGSDARRRSPAARLRVLSCQLLWVLLICLAGGCSPRTTEVAEQTRAAPTAEALQKALRSEFDRLGIDPARVAAAAPAGAANAVFDLAGQISLGDPITVALTWTERVLGDYNQDGLVGVSDLTPIGQRYDDTVDYDDPAAHGGITWWPTGDPDGAGAANWRLARVDGNGDGLIYMSDITTIAQHWNERLSGYRVYVLAPGETEFTMVPNPDDALSPLTVPRSAAAPANADQPVRYALNCELSGGVGVYQFYVVPYDEPEDLEGTPSQVLDLPEGGPPVAVLAVTPPEPTVVPFSASYSAADSYSPGGTIVQYDWDWDDNGLYNLLDGGPEPGYSEYVNVPGEYRVTVRVTDNHGLTDTATATVEGLYGEWFVTTVDAGSSNGRYCSLAEVAGRPAISYYDADANCLKYVRATDEYGVAGWQAPLTLTQDPAVEGQWTSLDLVSDRPAIAYYDAGNTQIRFIRADDASGASWPDASGISVVYNGSASSITLDNTPSAPAVAYRTAAKDIYFQRADDELGTGWTTPPVDVFETESDCRNPSMCMIWPTPAIAFSKADWQGNIHLTYVYAKDSAGAEWWTPMDPHLTGPGSADLGFMPCLASITGHPAITYCNGPLASMELSPFYVRSWDSQPVTGMDFVDPGPTDLTADAPRRAYPTKLASVGYYPHIVFRDMADRSLWHMWGTDMAGGNWLDPMLIDDGGGTNKVGWDIDLARIRDAPAVAYYDETAQHLKYAVLHQDT